MLSHTISRKYALGLFRAAQNAGKVSVVGDDLDAVADTFDRHEGLRGVLLNPRIREAEKEALVARIFRGKVDPLVERILDLLLRKFRMDQLPLLREDYRLLRDELEGLAECTVTTVVPLEPAERDRLVIKLQSISGKRVRLQQRIDSSIIGGAVVTIGNQVVDGSLKHELRLMADRLLGNTVVSL